MATRDDLRRAQARAMKEDDLLRDVRMLARQLGWETYHPLRSKGSEAGWPDLVLAKDGALLFRELKTEQGSLSPHQEKWISLLRAAGQDAAVWRPRHLFDGSIYNLLTSLATRPPDFRELALAPHDR